MIGNGTNATKRQTPTLANSAKRGLPGRVDFLTDYERSKTGREIERPAIRLLLRAHRQPAVLTGLGAGTTKNLLASRASEQRNPRHQNAPQY